MRKSDERRDPALFKKKITLFKYIYKNYTILYICITKYKIVQYFLKNYNIISSDIFFSLTIIAAWRTVVGHVRAANILWKHYDPWPLPFFSTTFVSFRSPVKLWVATTTSGSNSSSFSHSRGATRCGHNVGVGVEIVVVE